MKALAAIVILATSLCSGRAQTSTAATNVIRTPELLYITTSSNVMSISNAVKIASGLRVGMTKAEVDKYMHDHAMPTNVVGLSVDRGRTTGCYYPGSLVLEMECSQPPTSGLFRWKNPLLKRAYIQSQGANIVSITLTNTP